MRFIRTIFIYIIVIIFTTSCVATNLKNNSITGQSSSEESIADSYIASSSPESHIESEQESSESVFIPNAEHYYKKIYKNRTVLDSFMEQKLDNGFSEWIFENFGAAVLENIAETIENGNYEYELIYELTGMTGKVLYDEYLGTFDPNSAHFADNITKKDAKNGDDAVIVICGDVGLADNWRPMQYMDETNKKITDLIDPDFVKEMRDADITAVNNEFTISKREVQWLASSIPSEENLKTLIFTKNWVLISYPSPIIMSMTSGKRHSLIH